MKYKISTVKKNCVIEKELWQYADGNRISFEKGLEWGNIILNKKPNLETYNENKGISVWHFFEDELETNRDGEVWTKWVFPFNLTKEEKEKIVSLWIKESYSGLEKIGWLFVGKRLWFYGPLKIEEILKL